MNNQQHDLMQRIAATLRRDVGPAVTDDYARTQAFMSAVVLEKLATQLMSESAHVAADATDATTMCDDLQRLLPDRVPATVRDALEAVIADSGGVDALNHLVAALYAARSALGKSDFDAALGRVRATLRARIDREMEYSV